MCGCVSLRIEIASMAPAPPRMSVERARAERRVGQVLGRDRADLLLGEEAARRTAGEEETTAAPNMPVRLQRATSE